MDALIIYVSIGSGHRRAAEVLAETFTRQLGWRCHTVDLLSTLWPGLPSLANNLSAWLLKIAASFYDQYWADDEALRALDRLLTFTDMVGLMRDLVAENEPALCVCTHALPARILSLVWQKDGRVLPTLNVATDFMVNGLWPVEQIAGFVVASEASRRRLLARGLCNSQIYPLGIPVAARFSTPAASRARVRRKLGLADKPTLLVIVGSLRAEPYEQIARSVRQLWHYWISARSAAPDCQMVVVAGQNRSSLTNLRSLAAQLPFPVTLLPFVNHIEEWMAASDLLLTKPGGLTAAEALSQSLPLLLVGIGPGQEQANADLLVAEGCAEVGAGETGALAGQIASLLADEERRKAMRYACWALARPQAAQEIACLAQSILHREVVHE